jgi:hypothetical protein
MAIETKAQAVARLTAEFPILNDYVGGEAVPLDAAAYTQRIGEWADAQIAQQVADAAAAARAVLLAQFIAGMEDLRNDQTLVNARIASGVALSAAEIRIGFRDVLKAMIWLGDRIASGDIQARE